MEIRKRFDIRKVFMFMYALAFAIYIIIGLQPVGATDYEITGELRIPQIELVSDVAKLHIKDHKLETPDEIVGSFSRTKNKTLLIGHSTTVFQGLGKIVAGDEINYNGKVYTVNDTKVLAREEIEMDELLQAEEKDTLIIMTCAGELLGEGEATHRLLVTAELAAAE